MSARAVLEHTIDYLKGLSASHLAASEISESDELRADAALLKRATSALEALCAQEAAAVSSGISFLTAAQLLHKTKSDTAGQLRSNQK